MRLRLYIRNDIIVLVLGSILFSTSPFLPTLQETLRMRLNLNYIWYIHIHCLRGSDYAPNLNNRSPFFIDIGINFASPILHH